MQNYNWSKIKNINILEEMRMNAMYLFLNDFDKGKNEERYIYHELPNKAKYQENAFDIGLSSRFLLMYTGLGYDFHIKTINEMLRILRTSQNLERILLFEPFLFHKYLAPLA
jgi:hypothetical protein